MNKLFSFFNTVFSDGLNVPTKILELATKHPSVNGVYLCLNNYLKEGYLDVRPNVSNTTWINLLFDGNYLYGDNLTIVYNNSLFNNKPSIEFNNSGNTYLRYKKPVTVGTLIMVYALKQNGSYIIYAPRLVPNTTLYYDAFPSGFNTLWQEESLTGNSIYNANSRINGKDVLPTASTPLNTARILSVRDISNAAKKEVISGYGGQSGAIGGAAFTGGNNSFKGYLAAILTFEDSLDVEDVLELEAELAKYYISYTGASQIAFPVFKNLLNTNFSYDFSNVFVDEWFDITSYELVGTPELGLSFGNTIETRAVLSGTLTQTFKDSITIKVTNSASLSKTFTFPFEVCVSDPIVLELPSYSNLVTIFSAHKDINNNKYGLVTDINGKVTEWEDARRVSGTVTIQKYLNNTSSSVNYVDNDAVFNNKGSVHFASNSSLNGSSISAKTFVWVYSQDQPGVRNMLSGFPDIRGTGVLWTVNNINETHGDTNVTRLNTRIQNIPINTLNYKLPLNTPVIITATAANSDTITFSGVSNLKGKLAFFACWNTVLTNSELTDVVTKLAQRYANSLNPYVLDTSTEYKNLSNVTIDLKNKVVDLQNLPLTYEILTPQYGASIDSNGILTLTVPTDNVFTMSVKVTNSNNLYSVLTFDIDVSIRVNPLYLQIKTLFNNAINFVFIPEVDTLLLDSTNVLSIEDYRLNDVIATGSNVKYSSLPQLDNSNTLEFSLVGNSYLDFTTVNGKCFVLGYIKKENNSGKAFLFGQNSTADFIPGDNDAIWDSTTSLNVLNSQTYVNSKQVTSSYKFAPILLNTVAVNTVNTTTINTIGKDRVFNDRSVKGYIPFILILNRNITSEEAILLNKYIRDYFTPARFIFLGHFDTAVIDNSFKAKVLDSNANISTTVKKFGAGSLQLVNDSAVKYVSIPNSTDFSFLHEDFTVSFNLYINKLLASTDYLYLYSQVDLFIYIYNNILYVGRNTLPDLALLSYSLSGSFINNFRHVAVLRQLGILYLYVEGTLVGSTPDTVEYRDYSSPVLIGQTSSILTTGLNVYIDELAVARRVALHTGTTYSVPTVPYLT